MEASKMDSDAAPSLPERRQTKKHERHPQSSKGINNGHEDEASGEYEQYLAQAHQQDLASVAATRAIYVAGEDRQGRTCVVLCPDLVLRSSQAQSPSEGAKHALVNVNRAAASDRRRRDSQRHPKTPPAGSGAETSAGSRRSEASRAGAAEALETPASGSQREISEGYMYREVAGERTSSSTASAGVQTGNPRDSTLSAGVGGPSPTTPGRARNEGGSGLLTGGGGSGGGSSRRPSAGGVDYAEADSSAQQQQQQQEDLMLLHFLRLMDGVSQKEYVVLLCGGGGGGGGSGSGSGSGAGREGRDGASRRWLSWARFSFLGQIHSLLPRRYKKNLAGLVVLQPTPVLDTFFDFANLFLSRKFYRKLEFVESVAELTAKLPRRVVENLPRDALSNGVWLDQQPAAAASTSSVVTTVAAPPRRFSANGAADDQSTAAGGDGSRTAHGVIAPSSSGDVDVGMDGDGDGGRPSPVHVARVFGGGMQVHGEDSRTPPPLPSPQLQSAPKSSSPLLNGGARAAAKSRFHRATLERRYSTCSGAGTVTGPNTPSPGHGHQSTPRSSACSTPSAGGVSVNTTLAVTGDSAVFSTRSRSGSCGAVGFPVGNGGDGSGEGNEHGGFSVSLSTSARKSLPSCLSFSPGTQARSRPVGKMTVSHSSGNLPSASAAAAAAVSGVYASVPGCGTVQGISPSGSSGSFSGVGVRPQRHLGTPLTPSHISYTSGPLSHPHRRGGSTGTVGFLERGKGARNGGVSPTTPKGTAHSRRSAFSTSNTLSPWSATSGFSVDRQSPSPRGRGVVTPRGTAAQRGSWGGSPCSGGSWRSGPTTPNPGRGKAATGTPGRRTPGQQQQQSPLTRAHRHLQQQQKQQQQQQEQQQQQLQLQLSSRPGVGNSAGDSITPRSGNSASAAAAGAGAGWGRPSFQSAVAASSLVELAEANAAALAKGPGSPPKQPPLREHKQQEQHQHQQERLPRKSPRAQRPVESQLPHKSPKPQRPIEQQLHHKSPKAQKPVDGRPAEWWGRSEHVGKAGGIGDTGQPADSRRRHSCNLRANTRRGSASPSQLQHKHPESPARPRPRSSSNVLSPAGLAALEREVRTRSAHAAASSAARASGSVRFSGGVGGKAVGDGVMALASPPAAARDGSHGVKGTTPRNSATAGGGGGGSSSRAAVGSGRGGIVDSPADYPAPLRRASEGAHASAAAAAVAAANEARARGGGNSGVVAGRSSVGTGGGGTTVKYLSTSARISPGIQALMANYGGAAKAAAAATASDAAAAAAAASTTASRSRQDAAAAVPLPRTLPSPFAIATSGVAGTASTTPIAAGRRDTFSSTGGRGASSAGASKTPAKAQQQQPQQQQQQRRSQHRNDAGGMRRALKEHRESLKKALEAEAAVSGGGEDSEVKDGEAGARGDGRSLSTQRGAVVPNPAKVFGVPLADMMRRNSDRGEEVPWVLQRFVGFLSKFGMESVGLFRLAGDGVDRAVVREAIDHGKPVCWDPEEGAQGAGADRGVPLTDVNMVAQLLKAFFRELPEPLIPFSAYDKVIMIAKAAGVADGRWVQAMKTILWGIPNVNYNCLKFLFEFLREVAMHSSTNRMTSENLAIVWAPNLLRPEDDDPFAILRDLRFQIETVRWMVDFCDQLFDD
eukprot:g20063.t1